MSKRNKKCYFVPRQWLLVCCFLLAVTSCRNQLPETIGDCPPTPYDEIGPFYKSNTPVRSSVGSGYLLEGQVKSVRGCRPLSKAKIEFWLVNEEGEYDEAHRATVFSGRKGRYSFESNRPSDYVGRLPHIHIMVSAKGHETLITQHYPRAGQAKGHFDLILTTLEQD
ncbi:MAG: intradiol ring-cleavage dioxygenase [Thermodesulfobacteriota bacterium]